ncbi:MAG: hypothetical protein WA902_18315 [Thermosynechococcaceae cyanobacterium]
MIDHPRKKKISASRSLSFLLTIFLASLTQGCIIVETLDLHEANKLFDRLLVNQKIPIKSRSCKLERNPVNAYCTFSVSRDQVTKLINTLRLEYIDPNISLDSLIEHSSQDKRNILNISEGDIKKHASIEYQKSQEFWKEIDATGKAMIESYMNDPRLVNDNVNEWKSITVEKGISFYSIYLFYNQETNRGCIRIPVPGHE